MSPCNRTRLLALVLAALAAAPLPAGDVPFELVIPDEGLPLTECAAILGELLGQPIAYAPEDLAGARLFATGTLRVEPGDELAFAEALLEYADCVLLERDTGAGALLEIVTERGLTGDSLAAHATEISPSDLDAWRHRGALVSLWLPLQHTDARTMMAVAHPALGTPGSVRNTEKANALWIVGRARAVAAVADIVRTADQPAQLPDADWQRRLHALEERIAVLERR